MRRFLALAALLVAGCATYGEPYAAYPTYPAYSAYPYGYTSHAYPAFIYRPRLDHPPRYRAVTPPHRHDWHGRRHHDTRRWHDRRREHGEQRLRRGDDRHDHGNRHWQRDERRSERGEREWRRD